MAETLTGTFGEAVPIDLDPARDRLPEHTLAVWLLNLPQAHPFWSQYLLSLVHLRGMPDQTSSHQLMLLALNPERGPFTPENLWEEQQGPGWFLSPPNIVENLADATDDQARELVDLVARGLVDGVLDAEPDGIMGARSHWRATLDLTLKHLRQRGRPAKEVTRG